MNKVIIEVRELIGSIGADIKRTFTQEFEPITTETTSIEFMEPVSFDIRIENTGSGMRVTGHIKSALKLICSRCLGEYRYPVDWNVDEIFYEGVAPDDDAYTMTDTTIDLGPPTEEQFVLSIPIKPLCDEGCQGICQVCGEVITAEHKPHDEDKIDERLAVLKQLLDADKSE